MTQDAICEHSSPPPFLPEHPPWASRLLSPLCDMPLWTRLIFPSALFCVGETNFQFLFDPSSPSLSLLGKPTPLTQMLPKNSSVPSSFYQVSVRISSTFTCLRLQPIPSSPQLQTPISSHLQDNSTWSSSTGTNTY